MIKMETTPIDGAFLIRGQITKMKEAYLKKSADFQILHTRAFPLNQFKSITHFQKNVNRGLHVEIKASITVSNGYQWRNLRCYR